MANDFLAKFQSDWQVLDPQVAEVLAQFYKRFAGERPLCELTPIEARQLTAKLNFFFGCGAPAIPHIEEIAITGASGPIRLRLYDPGVPAPAPALIFLHGGGWVTCDIDVYDPIARQLAKRSGLRVLSVDYGLAPEHPFPVGIADCVAGLDWAMSEGRRLGIDPNRVALAGDSAGANLAISTALVLRDKGAILPRALALFYGAYSRDMNTSSCAAYGSGAYLMGTADMEWYWRHYLRDPADATNSLASPLLAELKGLPPTYVAACEFDVLRSDSEALASKLKSEGVLTTFALWRGMVHASINLMGWIDAMGPYVDDVGAFLRRAVASDN